MRNDLRASLASLVFREACGTPKSCSHDLTVYFLSYNSLPAF
jgi:hypothetical protein